MRKDGKTITSQERKEDTESGEEHQEETTEKKGIIREVTKRSHKTESWERVIRVDTTTEVKVRIDYIITKQYNDK